MIAKQGLDLYETMGTPTLDDLEVVICINIIKNNVVTTDNANLATKAYGPYVGGIKGKNTRSGPTTVVRNIVEIPNEFLEVQKYLTVSMDQFTLNYLKILSKITHKIYYRTTQYVAKPVTSV